MPQLAYYPAAGSFFASRGDLSEPSVYASRVFAKKTEQTSGHTTLGILAVYLMLMLIILTVLSGMASSDDILFAGSPKAFLSPAAVDRAVKHAQYSANWF